MSTGPTERVMQYNYASENEDGQLDILTNLFHWGPWIISVVRGTRKYAVSYRDVLVSAGAVVNNPETQELAVVLGQNYTPHQGATKYCAEMHADSAQKRNGYQEKTAVFVSASIDKDTISTINPIPAATLWPCEPCHDVLDESTIVTSINDQDQYEVRTGRQLRAMVNYVNTLTQKQAKRFWQNHEMEPPVVDPGLVQWPQRLAEYQERTCGLSCPTDEGLRVQRAEIFVEVLMGSVIDTPLG